MFHGLHLTTFDILLCTKKQKITKYPPVNVPKNKNKYIKPSDDSLKKKEHLRKQEELFKEFQHKGGDNDKI